MSLFIVWKSVEYPDCHILFDICENDKMQNQKTQPIIGVFSTCFN